MASITFTIMGTTPLLTHNPSSMQQASGTGRKKIPTPEEEAEAGTYRLPDRTLGFPAGGIRRSILDGATGLRVNRKAAKPFLAGSLLVADPMFPVLDGEGDPARYAIDTQRAVVQHQGIMRSRPRIDLPWLIPCVFAFNQIIEERLLEPLLTEALREAGRIVGIGDYRVQKMGTYGCYQAEQIKVVG